jgi:ComF family protein
MFFSYLKRIIFPQSCLSCNKIITKSSFCANHWKEVEFITDPYCQICHLPFEYKINDRQICASCIAKRPYYKKLVAICKYNDIIAGIISRFKFFDQSYLAKKLCPLFYPKLDEFISKIDLIIPVPLHKNRLKVRKYNQSLLLAKFIAKKYNIKFVPDLLIRIKEGKNQIGLNKNARIRNVASAFIINDKYLELIKGKNILLIDDVVTTGATIDNCSKILVKSKSGDVFVAVIAKRIL